MMQDATSGVERSVQKVNSVKGTKSSHLFPAFLHDSTNHGDTQLSPHTETELIGKSKSS